jgi:hypothetical protein
MPRWTTSCHDASSESRLSQNSSPEPQWKQHCRRMPAGLQVERPQRCGRSAVQIRLRETG